MVIPITLFELLMTLIPFSYSLVPFLLFRKKWSKNVPTTHLFRLLFILKIQFSMPLIGMLLLAEWTKMESIYIFIDNYLVLFLLVFLIIPPFILKIKLIKKITWAVSNYISNLTFTVVIVFILSLFPDSYLLEKKMALITPTSEYQEFSINYNRSDTRIDETRCIMILNINKEEVYLRNTQFAEIGLVLRLLKIDSWDMKKHVKVLDSMIKKNIKDRKPKYMRSIFELKKIDTLRLRFNKSFYYDLKYTDTIKLKFQSNREISKLHNRLLKFYDSIYKPENFAKELLNKKSEVLVYSDPDYYIFLQNISLAKLSKLKKDVLKMEEQLDDREKQSRFLSDIYMWPVKFVFN